jgi:hypothetical protein
MRTWGVRTLFCTGLQLALICSSPLTLFSQSTNASPSAAAATLPPYGGCAAPSRAGINVCVPGTGFEVPAPFQVIAAGTSGRAQVKLMELWADGKKVTHTDGTPFDEPVSLGLGNHELTVIEVDTIGNYVKSTPFQVTVVPSQSGFNGQNCPPPDRAGVNICAPLPNGCNTQPWVNIVATGRGKSGTVNRMELWNAGTKIANFPGDRIDTNLIMLFGTVTIYEVDSKGAALSSSISYNGPC